MIELTINGIPKPKQSVRFTKSGIRYKSKDVVIYERSIRTQVNTQIPKGFKILDEPVTAYVTYVFPIPSSFSLKKKEFIKNGGVIYKDTKPDLIDNLNKALFDALQGIVLTNDSRVCDFSAKKIYGFIPRAEIKISPIKNTWM